MYDQIQNCRKHQVALQALTLSTRHQSKGFFGVYFFFFLLILPEEETRQVANHMGFEEQRKKLVLILWIFNCPPTRGSFYLWEFTCRCSADVSVCLESNLFTAFERAVLSRIHRFTETSAFFCQLSIARISLFSYLNFFLISVIQ